MRLIETMNKYIISTEKVWNINSFHKHQKEGWFLITDNNLLCSVVSILNPRMIFFPHWSWKIPNEIYEKYECVMFHMTNLPFGKGKEPLQWLIETGYAETMLTVFKCSAEMDSGPIYAKIPFSLSGSAEECYNRCSDIIFEYIDTMIDLSNRDIEIIPKIQVGTPSNCGQPTPEILLEATDTLEELYNKIRAWDAWSYPRAYFDIDEFSFEFSNAVMRHDYIEAHVKIRMVE